MLSQVVPDTFLVIPDVESCLGSSISVPGDNAGAMTPAGSVRNDRITQPTAPQAPASQTEILIDLMFTSFSGRRDLLFNI